MCLFCTAALLNRATTIHVHCLQQSVNSSGHHGKITFVHMASQVTSILPSRVINTKHLSPRPTHHVVHWASHRFTGYPKIESFVSPSIEDYQNKVVRTVKLISLLILLLADSELNAEKNNLVKELDQLQSNYDNVTKERDDLKKRLCGEWDITVFINCYIMFFIICH